MHHVNYPSGVDKLGLVETLPQKSERFGYLGRNWHFDVQPWELLSVVSFKK